MFIFRMGTCGFSFQYRMKLPKVLTKGNSMSDNNIKLKFRSFLEKKISVFSWKNVLIGRLALFLPSVRRPLLNKVS